MCSVSTKGKKWKGRDIHTTVNVIISQNYELNVENVYFISVEIKETIT